MHIYTWISNPYKNIRAAPLLLRSFITFLKKLRLVFSSVLYELFFAFAIVCCSMWPLISSCIKLALTLNNTIDVDYFLFSLVYCMIFFCLCFVCLVFLHVTINTKVYALTLNDMIVFDVFFFLMLVWHLLTILNVWVIYLRWEIHMMMKPSFTSFLCFGPN